MDETVTMGCMLCLRKREVRHIPLYVWGSEGVWACHECEMKLIKTCQEMALQALRRRRAEHDRSNERRHDESETE